MHRLSRVSRLLNSTILRKKLDVFYFVSLSIPPGTIGGALLINMVNIDTMVISITDPTQKDSYKKVEGNKFYFKIM